MGRRAWIREKYLMACIKPFLRQSNSNKNKIHLSRILKLTLFAFLMIGYLLDHKILSLVVYEADNVNGN